MREVTAVRDVNWRGVSDRGARILRVIAAPLVAGYSTAEIAYLLQERRDLVVDLRPPDPVTATWVWPG
jgi:hypothetical protein